MGHRRREEGISGDKRAIGSSTCFSTRLSWTTSQRACILLTGFITGDRVDAWLSVFSRERGLTHHCSGTNSCSSRIRRLKFPHFDTYSSLKFLSQLKTKQPVDHLSRSVLLFITGRACQTLNTFFILLQMVMLAPILKQTVWPSHGIVFSLTIISNVLSFSSNYSTQWRTLIPSSTLVRSLCHDFTKRLP